MRYGVAGDTSSFFFSVHIKVIVRKKRFQLIYGSIGLGVLAAEFKILNVKACVKFRLKFFYGIDRNLVYSLVAKSNKNWRPTTKQNSGNSYLVCFVQGFQEMSKHTSVLFIFSGMSALYKLRRSTIGV